ncbi:MAG TPA: hypothetical protein VF526_15515 [Solirubrobacteraceae bacterium]|jgi:predicted ATPase
MKREQRALLFLDDLHWAARPTLLLLRHLIRTAVATCRTVLVDLAVVYPDPNIEWPLFVVGDGLDI